MFNIVSKIKNKRSLWPYLFEFITVLLSVYLAFFITSWREDHKEQIATEVAIERLNQEIFQNYKSLITFKSSITKRYEELKEIEPRVSNKHKFSSKEIGFIGFVTSSYNNATWKRVSNNSLGNFMPVDYLEDAHKLYERNQVLLDINDQISNFIFSDLFFERSKCETAYSLSSLCMWQQAMVAINNTYYYTKFIKDFQPDFQKMLDKDSTVSEFYTSRSRLSEHDWKELDNKERQYVNQLRGNTFD